jgi:hypothetical protein
MPARAPYPRPIETPRPLTSRDLSRRLDDLLDAVARLSRSTGAAGPRWLPTADLVRCLDALVSRN